MTFILTKCGTPSRLTSSNFGREWHSALLRVLELTLPPFVYIYQAARRWRQQALPRGAASRPARCEIRFIGFASAPRPSRSLGLWLVAHQTPQAPGGLPRAIDDVRKLVARQRRFPHQRSAMLIQAFEHMFARGPAAVDRSVARIQPLRPVLARPRPACRQALPAFATMALKFISPSIAARLAMNRLSVFSL